MVSMQLQTSTWHPEAPKPTSPPDPNTPRRLGTLRGLGRKLDAQDPRVIHEAAALLTSQLFFAPLLAEMRKLPFGRQFAHGGRMEEVFGEQLDLHVADAVARSDRGFTEQLAGQLASRHRPQPARAPAPQRATWPAELRARQTIERSKH